MRIVEFVGVVVAVIAFVAWIIGEPHTLASIRRDAGDAEPPADDEAPR